MEDLDLLKVERIGGFCGFGLPGSHLRSKGEISISELSPEDLGVIDKLFRGNLHFASSKADAFFYRITRKIGDSEQTIEAPEELIPLSVQCCVKDILE